MRCLTIATALWISLMSSNGLYGKTAAPRLSDVRVVSVPASGSFPSSVIACVCRLSVECRKLPSSLFTSSPRLVKLSSASLPAVSCSSTRPCFLHLCQRWKKNSTFSYPSWVIDRIFKAWISYYKPALYSFFSHFILPPSPPLAFFLLFFPECSEAKEHNSLLCASHEWLKCSNQFNYTFYDHLFCHYHF